MPGLFSLLAAGAIAALRQAAYEYVATVTSTPEQFAAFLKTDREYIGQLVRQYNVPKN